MSQISITDPESLKLFQNILNAVSEHVVVVNGEGLISWCNQSLIEFGLKHGLKPDHEWIGTDYFELAKNSYGCSAETNEKVYKGISDVLSGKQDHLEIVCSCDNSDEIRWFRLHVNGFNLDEEPGVILIHLDVTGQMQEAESQKSREQVFRATFEQAAVGVAHVSPAGKFIRINQKFCDIVGYSAQEMLNRTFQEITHPADLESDLEQVNLLLQGRKNTYSIEKRYYHKNGSTIWVRLTVSLVLDNLEVPDYFISVIEDITDRKNLEKTLRESEERFRNLMEQSPISIQVHTPDGKLYQSNSAYAKLYALNKETLKELYERYNIREDQQALKLGVSSHIEKVFSGKRVLFPEYEYDGVDTLKTLDFNHPVSRKCWVQTRGFPVKDQSGQVVYAVFLSEDITTRKTAEEKLQESEESYRALIEQAKDGIAVIQEGVITYSNEALTRLSGFDKGEMIGRSFEEFIVQDHLQTVKENYIYRMNNDPAPSIYESGIIHKEGHHLDVEFKAAKSVVNGKLTDIVIVRDISQRKKQQRKLEENENRFRALYDNASFALGMAKGVKVVHELVNQAWVDLFGYSDVSEVLGIPIMDFVAPEDRAKVAKYAQLRNEGKFAPPVYEIRGLRKDGTTFDMEMRVSTYMYEEELHSIAMITDITDRKAAQKERDRIFNLSSDLITVLGFDGFFKHLNPAWEEVMGYETHELLEHPFISFIHPDDREKTSEEVKKLNKGVPTIHFENRYITKDGSVMHFSWKATPLPEAGLIYAIARDITEFKESQEQIFKYQRRLKDLGTELTLSEEKQRQQIAADLHDHVGQLMASSRLQLAALHNGLDKAEILSKTGAVSQGLLRAIQATRHAIFDLSPPQLNEIGLFAATADWLEEQMEVQHGFRTRISGDDRLFLMNDKIRLLLFRCIRELLMNVVKHSGASKVHVEMTEEEKQLKITVQDDGKGFNYSPEMLRLKSTGFGLFSIQERLEDLGGKMEIYTTPGEGTEVTMLLPLNE